MNTDSLNTASPLKMPQFCWLFTSNMAFFFAMGSQNIARSWLAFQLTQSELAMGMITAAIAIPMFFIAPFGGVYSDRLDRRNTIISGQLIVLTAELSIAILLFFDKLEFWQLLAASGLMGCAFPFIMPARTAIIVNIVGKLNLGSAMGINMAGMNTTRIIGPAAAGFLIDMIGITRTYFIGVGLFFIGVLFMFKVNPSPPVDEPDHGSVFRSVADGMVYMFRNKLVLVLLVFGLVPMFLSMPFQNLLVVFAEKIWDVGSQGFGVLSAVGGVGGFVGSVWVASKGNTNRRCKLMMNSMMLFGGFLVCFSFSPYYLLALPMIFGANLFSSIFGTLNNTAIQLAIPDSVRGRISAFMIMSFTLPLLGTLPVAALAEVWGAPLAVGLAALLAMAVSVIFYTFSRSLRTMDEALEAALFEEEI